MGQISRSIATVIGRPNSFIAENAHQARLACPELCRRWPEGLAESEHTAGTEGKDHILFDVRDRGKASAVGMGATRSIAKRQRLPRAIAKVVLAPANLDRLVRRIAGAGFLDGARRCIVAQVLLARIRCNAAPETI
jgi:hypothetical protein